MTKVEALTEEQLQRYSRQIILEEVGVGGQRRLLEGRVLVVGAGGLGSPAALYLAAAGVGTIGIVDGDRVDLTNLHRQILHFNHDIGRPKTQSARRTLEDVNPDVRVVPHQTVLTSANALEILSQYDVVINGSDNFPTRYLVNDACVLLGKPLVDASILRWEGQATTFLPGRGCYRCLFPSPPPPGAVPSCAEAGIVGAVAGFMGTHQALEAIKILLGVGETLANRLMLFDALSGEIRFVRWTRNPDCPVCGDHPTLRELIDYEAFCGVPAHDRSVEVQPAPAEVSVAEVDGLLREGAVLLDVREAWEVAQAHIEGMRWIPMGQVEARYHEIPRDRTVVVYCASGQRSGKVTQWLRERGYDRVFNLVGGILAWQNAGRPVRTGLPEPEGEPAGRT
ncbi:MAG: molybdopterin-synthase adenylyltransferase MoeB [Armatimonadota bacterium]|nr:molybdopterin-synthase adenylyltransferase MoeB [Armatimonadota bacterium]MDR7389402.1 molybdopterin-synthase adenylyltransferase MoeB [Armatimonadota bacterium]MDR7391791.1 molybdopterin-synthase adenylyltransferase MoeB [Armatimonadota bacterium]MDR7394493.1 molybdopterin-synthase adenylyltransferase MoeB [Armatimonadota bacterium]MDR7397006.1 molybdopterin-synthase adenylyltransferase MoeB [Armatimonadota bacterium]